MKTIKYIIGAVITGFVVSLLAAIFVVKRSKIELDEMENELAG